MLDIAACAGVNELPSQGEISPSIRGSFFDPRTQATATVITTRMLPLSLDRAVSIPGSDFHHGLLGVRPNCSKGSVGVLWARRWECRTASGLPFPSNSRPGVCRACMMFFSTVSRSKNTT